MQILAINTVAIIIHTALKHGLEIGLVTLPNFK